MPSVLGESALGPLRGIPRDGDGDGQIFDGTRRERAVPRSPALPQHQPAELRAFGDSAAIRARIMDRVREAASVIPPVTNQRHILTLEDVGYEGATKYGIGDWKKAILGGRSLGTRLRGTWVLKDNATGAVVDRKRSTVATVPYLTDHGTFIQNGSEYTLSHQLRLRPGVFTRVQANGELEAHVNVMPGKGLAHRIFMEPDTGVFRLKVGQSKMPLVPLLRAMGATDKQLRDAWGDLYQANMLKDDPSVIHKLHERLVRKPDPNKTPEGEVREAFESMRLDPEVTKRTLGKSYDRVSLDQMLDTTKKLVAISHGQAEPDDRDHLAYMTTMGPEDLLAERVGKDRMLLGKTLWKASMTGSLQHVQPELLTRGINAAIQSSGLGQPTESINPSMLFDQQARVSRLGVGGIPSLEGIPPKAHNVQPSHFGLIDPLYTPESLHVGVDGRVTQAALKGDDGRLYSPFRNVKTGQMEHRSAQDLADATIAFPGELKTLNPYVSALVGGKIRDVPRNQVQYELPNMDDAFSAISNLVPLKSTIKGQREVMATRMLTQALPLKDPQAPLVQAGIMGSDGDSYESRYGKHMGALYSDVGGIVQHVDKDKGKITVKGDDGKMREHDLYINYPYNRKTYVHQTPVVGPGDRVAPGALLARSNYTDDKGVTAIGQNARVAYLPFRGFNFEDAIVVSESMAKRMSSEHMYQHSLDAEDDVKPGKKSHVSIFPGKFDRAALDTIDDDGAVKPGTIVTYDSPLILAVKQRERTYGAISRGRAASWADHSETWKHHAPGEVTDVEKTPNGIVVSVKSLNPMEVGDKISGRMGDKGVVSAIVPDHEMPHDTQGRPFEVLLNPLGVITRCYDEWTEFLTQDGWKFGREVLPDDWLMSYDTKNDGLVMLGQKGPIHATQYHGPMLRYRNKVMDFCVTPNHKMWTKGDWPDAPWQERQAREIFGKRYYVPIAADGIMTVDQPGDFPIPPLDRRSVKDTAWTDAPIVIDAGDWAEFLGWYMAEGNVDWNERDSEYKTHISQSDNVHPEHYAEIAALLRRLPFQWHYNSKNIQFHITSKRLAGYLRQFGLSHEKFIPDWVFAQTLEVRRRFLNAYWKGDGSDRPNPSGSVVSTAGTVSRRLADDVQRLCLFQGQAASVYPKGKERRATHRSGWTVSRSKARQRLLNADGWSEVTYEGMIYCPTVPTGYVVTRRNGRVLIAGNTNPAQKIEAALGKVAEQTGQPYRVVDFDNDRDYNEWAIQELARHGMSSAETVHDPVAGRDIPRIMTGNRWFMKLHHTAEAKGQGRGTGGYTAEGAPARGGEAGSKRISLMDINALLSHGATEVLRDAGAVRGQQHPEFWQQFMSGHAMPTPKTPMIYDKFLNLLKASGINVVRQGSRLNVMALSNNDVNELAGNREITAGDTVDWKGGLKPLPGGLFDEKLTGAHGGNRWAYIKLAEPLPNPVMEEPIRRMLGLTKDRFLDVIAGKEQLGDHTGPVAIAKALDNIDVKQAIVQARADIRSGRKGIRDAAVHKLGYLKTAQRLGMHPRDWMLDKAPVLPPIFRPVSTMAGSKLPMVADANYLYKELIDARDNLRDMKGTVNDLSNERLAAYQTFKAVTGLGDPIHPKNQERGVRGMLKQVFGNSPKSGMLQRKLLASATDLVGRATIVPNPDLDMDQVGLPETRAWDVYQPFIIRRLVRRGMNRVDAVRAVKERKPEAREAMVHEMDARPVILNRAPVHHRYGIMAFRPRLEKGETLHVSPLIVTGFNADFDGDAMQYHVPATDEAVRDAYEKMLPSRNLLAASSFKPHQLPGQEYAGGLYSASTLKSDKRPRVFATKADAMAAYRRGDINVDQPVEIVTDH